MTIDATFWVAISFFIFLGVLIYLKVPQKINSSLTNQINEIKKELDEAEKLKVEAKNLLSDYEDKIDKSKKEVQKITNLAKKDSEKMIIEKTQKFYQIMEGRKKNTEQKITLMKKNHSSVVCSVYEQHLNPYFNIAEINSKGYLELVRKKKNRPKNRQDAPIVYQMSGLYTINVKDFLKNGKKIFEQIHPLKIDIESGLMIDTEFEFKLAKLIFEKNKKI